LGIVGFNGDKGDIFILKPESGRDDGFCVRRWKG